MPVLSSYFLFICLASLGLPLLNGFVGEFLILTGTFSRRASWGALAATGAILSAVYLLWAYQRLVYGDITQEKNRTLPDASARERLILAATCAMILLMGVASPLFTRRTEAASASVLKQMERPYQYLARSPAPPGAAPVMSSARGVSGKAGQP
jgi:NADH-quinone oxidoreductase subunit M